MDLINVLMTKEVVAICVGIVGVMHFIGMIPVKEKRLKNLVAWRRVAPVLPLFLGIGAAFFPGAVDGESVQWGTKILIGIMAGFTSAHSRKIVKRLLVDRFDKDGKTVQ